MNICKSFFLFGFALFFRGLLTFFFLRNLFNVFADLLDVFLQLADVLLNLTDVLLHFFDVLADFGKFLGGVVYRHLDKDSEINCLERNDRREYEQHLLVGDPILSGGDEESDKEYRMNDDRRRRADPARRADSCFPDVVRIFHAASIHLHCYNGRVAKSLVGNTHIVAGKAEIVPEVLAHLQKHGISTHANPDLYIRTYKSLGVEEARDLRERARLKPLGERRVFVIAAADVNREAQNALLKTLEEPAGNALIILIVPSPHTLLQTLRSRAQLLVLEGKGQRNDLDAKKFLSAVPQKRLDLLKPLLEKDEDDKRDLAAILDFLASLERVAAERDPSALHPIYRARRYITDRGALVKPLLEQVALLVPRM